MRTPIVLSIFALVTLFFLAFMVEQRFGLPLWPYGALITVLWSAIYLSVFYAVYWRVMRALVQRNVPLIYVFLGYFFGLALFEFVIAPVYLPVGWSIDRAVWYASTSIAVFPAATVICMLAYEQSLRQGFATIPEALPYWMPIPERIDRLSHKLPREKRGQILRIKARNQYVEITTEHGDHILRMALQDAITAAAVDGCQVHRSLWMARQQIQSLTYVDGNPKVVDTQGQLWPAGRKRVDAIRAVMAAQRPRK